MNERPTSTAPNVRGTLFDRLARLSVIWTLTTPVVVIGIFIVGYIGLDFLDECALLKPWLEYLGINPGCLVIDVPATLFVGEFVALGLGIASLCGRKNMSSSLSSAFGTILLSGTIMGIIYGVVFRAILGQLHML